MCWWACASRVNATARRRPDGVIAPDEKEAPRSRVLVLDEGESGAAHRSGWRTPPSRPLRKRGTAGTGRSHRGRERGGAYPAPAAAALSAGLACRVGFFDDLKSPPAPEESEEETQAWISAPDGWIRAVLPVQELIGRSEEAAISLARDRGLSGRVRGNSRMPSRARSAWVGRSMSGSANGTAASMSARRPSCCATASSSPTGRRARNLGGMFGAIAFAMPAGDTRSPTPPRKSASSREGARRRTQVAAGVLGLAAAAARSGLVGMPGAGQSPCGPGLSGCCSQIHSPPAAGDRCRLRNRRTPTSRSAWSSKGR
jgi:hypothetical protein